MSLVWVHSPKGSPSDEHLTVLEICVGEGHTVAKGDLIAELEGSKTTFEVEAPESGIAYWFAQKQDFLRPGDALAVICTESEEKPPPLPFEGNQAGNQALDIPNNHDDDLSLRFSEPALALAAQENIDLRTVAPEQDFVTVHDLEIHLASLRVDESPERKAPNRIALLGAGFGGQIAASVAQSIPGINIVGTYEDRGNLLSTYEVPTLGRISAEDIQTGFLSGLFDGVFISIMTDMVLRIELAKLANSLGIPLATLIHPKASIHPTSKIGEGALISETAKINMFAEIGRNVFINEFCNVDHHCQVGENTTFGPGVFLSGNATVGSDCIIGSSIAVEPGVQIGKKSRVGSGTAIVFDIPDNSTIASPRLDIR